MKMIVNLPTLLLVLVSTGFAKAAIENWEGCGGRLERALDALRRDQSTRRTRLEDEEPETGIIYQKELRSAPLEMTVSRISVKLPQDSRGLGGAWAQVERCVYEQSDNSLQTRLVFNDLTVSGRVSLLPLDYRAPIPSESCRMTLRLRRAGIDFFTSPIARGRGQMRIRTESSFLEPRFASIYAYGCRPTRGDKQIKRQDKWQGDKNATVIPPEEASADYEAAEPRITRDKDVAENETRKTRALPRPGIWRESGWVTRSRRRREVADITPREFAAALAKKARSLLNEGTEGAKNESRVDPAETKANYKRETTETPVLEEAQRPRELLLEEELRDGNFADDEFEPRGWHSREGVTREMEDVFLRGASEALTSYIERQLHPAIKETLMLSMGYTISYG